MSALDRAPSLTIGTKADRTYVDRSAVRLVLHNGDSDTIAIIWAERGQYFKLPGGGVEGEEDHVLAAKREAMEETGCEVRVDQYAFATCEEWRDNLHQLSYCYRAQLVKDTGDVQLTEDELAEGLKHEWCLVEQALDKLKSASPISELGSFIQKRDVFFVEQFLASR